MANMKWETQGGTPTRGLVYSQMIEKMNELIELASMMAHLHNTEGNDVDKVLAKGWLGIGEVFAKVKHQITQLAMNRLQ